MKKRNEKWKVDLDLLTPKQLARYYDSLEVLGLVRNGDTINNASRKIGISIPTVKRYLGTVLKTKNHRVTARKTDSLLRNMRIYENGKQIYIQVKGRKKSSLIGTYHSAVGNRLDKNDTNALDMFENIKIKDIQGKVHSFETDLSNIIKILERSEGEETWDIYRRN